MVIEFIEKLGLKGNDMFGYIAKYFENMFSVVIGFLSAAAFVSLVAMAFLYKPSATEGECIISSDKKRIYVVTEINDIVIIVNQVRYDGEFYVISGYEYLMSLSTLYEEHGTCPVISIRVN